MTTRETGAVAGCSRSTVSRTLALPEIRAKVEAATNRIVTEGADDAVSTVLRLSKRGKDTEDKDWAKIGLDASKVVLTIPGIYGTTPSTIANTLIQINQAPEQITELRTLTAFLKSQWNKEPIEQTETTEREGTKDTQTIGISSPHTPQPDQGVIDIDQASELDTK